MSLSKEYTIYCLSESEGWVNIKTKYDFATADKENPRPRDTIMEIQFITDIPYANKFYKDERILFEIDDKNKLKKIQEKFGDRPESPYI